MFKKRVVLMVGLLLILLCINFMVYGESTPGPIQFSLSSDSSNEGGAVSRSFTLSQNTQVRYSFTASFKSGGYIEIVRLDIGRIYYRTSSTSNLYAESFQGVAGKTYRVTIRGGATKNSYGSYDYYGSFGNADLTLRYYELNSGTMMYDFKLSGPRHDDNNCSQTYYLYLPNPKTVGTGCHGMNSSVNINSSTDAELMDYPIHVWWNWSISNHKEHNNSSPEFNITVLDKDNNQKAGYTSTSGSFILPRNHRMRIYTNTGDAYNTNSWGSRTHYSYVVDYRIYYKLDYIAPGAPGKPQPVNGYYDPETDTYFVKRNSDGTVSLTWNAAIDDGPEFNGEKTISGIKTYYLYVDGMDTSNKKQQFDIDYGDPNSIHSGNVNSSILSEGITYTIRLQPEDRAKNPGDFSEAIKIMIDSEPPLPVAAPVAQTEPPVKEGFTKASTITWTWSAPADTAGIKEYRVYIQPVGEELIVNGLTTASTSYILTGALDGKEYKCWVKAVDYAGNASAVSEENKGAIKVDHSVPEVSYPQYSVLINGRKVTVSWNSITTDYSGVQKYQAALTTTMDEPSGGEEITSDINGRWEKTFTVGTLDDTYYAWVRGIDRAGNTGPWVRTGSFPSFDVVGPVNYIKTKELSPAFGIHQRSTEVKDLRFTVYYQTGAEEPREYTGSFPDEGQYTWWMEIYEYINEIKINESKQTSEHYTLFIDTTRPTGSFKVKSQDGLKDHTLIPTNNQTVLLTEIIENLKDDSGLVNSGVKGIYLWHRENQTPDGIPSVESPPSDATYFKAADILSNMITWLLPDRDGNYRINMIVEDGVGNYSIPIYRDITLDREAPGAPGNFSHTHRVENNTQYLKYIWQADVTEDDMFKVSYILPDNTEISVETPVLPLKVNEVYTGEYEINITQSGAGPNQLVKLKVIAVDPAGNEAGARCENVYTLAQPGELTNFTEDYYYQDGQYKTRFSCKLSGGVASSQCLEVSTNQDFTEDDTHKIRTVLPVNNQFTVDNLDGHGAYWYRLVAINNSIPQHATDRNMVNYGKYQVPNYAPVFPDNGEFKPVNNGYITCNVKFSYPEVNDPNNDAIKSYTVKYAFGENPASGAYQTALWDEKGFYYLTLDQSAHGNTYSWYVEAEDQLSAKSRSETFRFTVDTNVPAITLEPVVKPYTNQRQLQVTVTDDLSGIGKVQYTKTDAATNNPIGDPASIVLINGSGVIPLTEGYYHLNVITTDQAGNETVQAMNNIRADFTLPQLNNVAVYLNHTGGAYLSSGTIPVKWNATDTGSGIKGVRYWIMDQSGDPAGDGQYIALSHGLTDFAYTFEMPNKENGNQYYLAMTVYDRANNQSAVYKLNQPVLLDTTPPQVNFTVNGFHDSGSGYYLDDLRKLSVSLDATDQESSHSEELAIFKADGTRVSGWGDWDTVKSTGLIPGTRYRLVAKSVNGVGLETEVQSQLFVFDNTVPAAMVVLQPQNELATGETASYIVDAVDDESAIVVYSLAIGHPEKETALTSLIPENKNGWYEVKSNNKQANFRIEIPQIADGSYNAVIEVMNAAGLKTKINAGTIMVNNNRERIIVSDQGPFTLFNDRLTGWWKYIGSKAVTGYQFRVLDQDNQVIRDWQNTTETMLTISGLQLDNGKTYRFEVKAIFTGNDVSTSGLSPGVTVDATKPEIGKFNAPLYATPWNIGFTWEGKDDESGIKQIFIALGTDYQKNDLTKGWVEVAGNDAQLSCDANGEKLIFNLRENNRYYLTLRVINGAGLATDIIAPATIIDDTAPPVPVVTDQGAYINTSEKQPLDANWIWSVSDPESDTSYQWAILKYGEKVTPETVWFYDVASRKISLNMDLTEIPGETNYYPRSDDGKWYFRRLHGDTYYFAIKAINGAGLTSIGYSNGIMVDESAPIIPKVVLLDAANLGDTNAPEVNYITSTQGLGLWIDSLDPDNTPLDSYRYAWNVPEEVDETGRLSSENDQITLTGEILSQNPTLVEGQVNVFAGECSNEAILTSATGYSTGVILDTGAPKLKNVRGCAAGNSLLFDWEIASETMVSPIVKYKYILVREDQKNSIPDENLWQDAPDLSRRLIMDAKEISDGRYCLLIKGLNAAGTYSRREGELDEWGVSPVVVIDRTPPVLFEDEFKYPIFADQNIETKLIAEDKNPDTGAPGSGIQSYQYALGTRSNPFQFTDGWTDVYDQNGEISITIPTDNVPHNTGVYLMVRVKDNAGLWSKILTSRQILIDHTMPSQPVIDCGQYTNSLNEIKEIEYQSTDLESSLTSYRLGVVTGIGKEWLFTVLENINQFDGSLLNLNLTEAGVYYLAMQTQNGAGTWSETGYSGPVMVDTVKPVIIFTKAGEKIVINQPPLNLEYTLSENAQVRVITIGNDGASFEETVAGVKDFNQYVFNQTKPQEYIVSLIPTDLAGNIGLETEQTKQTIRVNAPPVVSLPEQIPTTPGRPLQLKATVTDPDGIEGDTFTFEWLPGDRGAVLSGATPEYRYTVLGDYTLTLSVTDKDGGKTTVTTKVKVGNTSSGTLYMDEVWSGIHRIYGDVTVPAGIKLTIRPGTQVIVDGIPGETGYFHGLFVKGTLVVEDAGAGFNSVIGEPGGWKGIRVEGQAIMNGAEIRDAARGLTVVSGAMVTVTNCNFRDNQIGIHIYRANPEIRSTAFRNNHWYGIKEDGECKPAVSNCTFAGNEVDYYHDQLTAVTMDELNEMPGNSGNSK